MSKNNELQLPHFGIQCDWEDALSASSDGKCWVSFRNFGQEKSVHGELKRASASAETIGSDTFQVIKEKSAARHLTIKDVKSQQECVFVATATALNAVHKAGVIALDVSEGGLGVSVCKNNELKVWETDTGSVRRVLQGHIIDAYHCKFFPSGIVILSGGTDCCIKIWSAETGDNPVTLRGHTGSIQDTCIIDRGRNIISVAKDGDAILWDCGEARNLDTLFSSRTVINSCCTMSPTNYELGSPIAHMSEREVSTGNLLLILGTEDGKVVGISVASRKQMFTCNLPSAVNKVIQIGTNAFAAGCQNGQIEVFQLDNISQPLLIKSSNSSSILDMLAHHMSPKSEMSSFWASKSDGSCILINVSSKTCSKIVQLTGPDCDPVYQVKKDLDFIYTASNGIIRKYSQRVINRFL